MKHFDNQYEGLVVGVDEAGRGPIAGPLVVAAVILTNYHTIPLTLNDSKKLAKKMREDIFAYLINNSFYCVSIIDTVTIDKINILEATKLGMYNVINSLNQKPAHILVDGNQLPEISLDARYHAIVKGDTLSASIAAASIIAKVTRDRLMTNLASYYPYYSWEKNAGYGTAQHLNAIQKYGVTTQHRKSFTPVKTMLNHV